MHRQVCVRQHSIFALLTTERPPLGADPPDAFLEGSVHALQPGRCNVLACGFFTADRLKACCGGWINVRRSA